MTKLKRVVDQFGNQVRMCCADDLLFFTEDNKFLRINQSEESKYSIDGIIFYHIASKITGRKK